MTLPGLDISVAFFAAALLLGIAPGPDNIFVLTQSALFGARAGIVTTLGLASGLCIQTVAVAGGVAAMLRASPWAFTVLKFFGAAYLCWLGWLSLRAGASETEVTKGAFPGYWALYGRGVIMNISNPKVLLFFFAFLPQFCMEGAGPFWLQIIYFGLLFIISALIVFMCVALLGGRLSGWLNKSAKTQIVMHRIAAAIFLGLALVLAFSDA